MSIGREMWGWKIQNLKLKTQNLDLSCELLQTLSIIMMVSIPLNRDDRNVTRGKNPRMRVF